ncbi:MULTISPECIES: acyl-CoA synthetase [unclassified Chelatococcus]|uniref:acyl-CoA synthetase n=1 Tax=unclassified Chelatococcus TaxID=2638111 RepID=UPI0002D4AE00|nr:MULTISPECIES: acyl-CoA synthetase [unclassified Chelatococcus]ALA17486.1 AMP-dependent synthetase [Chelatococcus sp. CO-6]
MLPDIRDYDALVAGFRWRIPERYNIGVDCCDRWAAAQPERPAILEVARDGTVEALTYGALRRRSNRLANALGRRGIAAGDRVAILLPQSQQVAIAHIAIYKLGAIALPLAMLFGVDALSYRLADAGARAVITNAAGLATLKAIDVPLPDLAVIVSTDGPDGAAIGFDEMLAEADEDFAPRATGPDDPAMMIYTSGTTGNPKGALHGHRVLLGHLPGVEMPHEFLPRPGDRLWTPADWAWAGGLLNVLLPGLHHGVPVVARKFEKFDPEEAFDLMARLEVCNTFIPPTALRMLRSVPRPGARFDLGLRTLASGGEALGEATFVWGREELGLTINEFYGQTECNLVLASCAAIGVSRAGAIGKPVPGHTVAVIRPDGTRCEPGELGQIAVLRPDPVMFLEYWRRPEATRDKFVGDWMTTGDQGSVDDDGYVHFVGRDDDVITSAGYRIGPGEIEDCLIKHEAVSLAAVVGKPDPVRTEIVKAFIVLRDGYAPSEALVADIKAFVRERLSAHEYPREIAFRDELPLTTTGKVIRRLLRSEA